MRVGGRTKSGVQLKVARRSTTVVMTCKSGKPSWFSICAFTDWVIWSRSPWQALTTAAKMPR
jgi:hypothetical protein